jgi:hypothetical protein
MIVAHVILRHPLEFIASARLSSVSSPIAFQAVRQGKEARLKRWVALGRSL